MTDSNSSLVYLRSNRVVLRPVLHSDVPLCLRWINDREVTQYLMRDLPMMEASEEKWFENLSARSDTDVVFIIVVDETPIGVMGIHAINWRDRTATTGSFIGEKEYWGKGYGTEAKMLVLHLAFHTLNLRKLSSSVIAYNKRSYAYSKKCGYTEEGVRKAQFFKHGTYWDEHLLAVFREDWEPLWRAFAEEHGIKGAPDA